MTTNEGSQQAFGERLPNRISVSRGPFYTVVVGTLGLYAVLMRDLLPLVATAWVVDTGSHRFHDLNFFALVWISIVRLAVQLYRPLQTRLACHCSHRASAGDGTTRRRRDFDELADRDDAAPLHRRRSCRRGAPSSWVVGLDDPAHGSVLQKHSSFVAPY